MVDRALRELVERWVRERPFTLPAEFPLPPSCVPPELAATITAREPYRSQALEDARTWLAVPKPFGLGLEVLLTTLPVVQPFAGWAESASPVDLRLTWAEDVSGSRADWASARVHRVAREDGAWRIVRLWGEEDVSQLEQMGRTMAEWRARTSERLPEPEGPRVLYEDSRITCDDRGITIRWYYFPWGTKYIPYDSIRSFAEHRMTRLTGRLRIWGAGSPRYWFHLDGRRPWKERAVIIEKSAHVHAVLTPDDYEGFVRVLRERVLPRR